MSDAFELEICQGKYRYRYEGGKQEVWRNGEPWEVMNGRLIGDKFVFSLAIELDEAIKERDALRAKIEQMEQQEPIGVLHVGSYYGEELQDWEFEANQCACDKLNEAYVSNPTSLPLYALPGAQARPAKNAVAYLDLGVGGYMDVGTDLTDEELAALPKGRHMLGIIGTYGVDGYVPAQNAPSVPDDVMRDAERYRYLRGRDDSTAGVGCGLEAGGKACARGWLNGDQLDRAIDCAIEALAAAPEAKP